MKSSEIQDNLNYIRKDLYRYINGIMSETLRNNNLPFKHIFGLILPQLKEISRQYPKDIDLAKELWKQDDCRESRLIGILLAPASTITKDDLQVYITGVKTHEEADLLAFFLLRNIPDSKKFYTELDSSDIPSGNELGGYLMNMYKRNIDQL